MLAFVDTPKPFDHLRASVRFPLHLPVALRNKATGVVTEVVAETHDISAGGVLFHCDPEADYQVGATIEFSIAMPAVPLGAKRDVQLACIGRVVRCNPVGDRLAVGAIIDEYTITR